MISSNLSVSWLTFATLFCMMICSLEARAQSDEVPRFELAAQFTSITKPDFNNAATEPGFGTTFTWNLNRNLAVEAVGNFFPRTCRFCGRNSGNITQGLFGVKAGKRFEKWGIFAKARPGVVSFSEGDTRIVSIGPGAFPAIQFQQNRLTHFATDLGGVLEFYPSKRIVTRFEAGDTLIHYGRHQDNFVVFDGTTNLPVLLPFTTPSVIKHNFQFTAGIGWRF